VFPSCESIDIFENIFALGAGNAARYDIDSRHAIGKRDCQNLLSENGPCMNASEIAFQDRRLQMGRRSIRNCPCQSDGRFPKGDTKQKHVSISSGDT
jgi:hypothetical protein